MWEKLLPVIVGAISGGTIATLIAPWINWRIEKRKQKLAYKRELIAKWRVMLADAMKTWQQTDRGIDGLNKVIELLYRDPSFYSLMPYLSLETVQSMDHPRAVIQNAEIPGLLIRISHDITNIESNWDLI